MCKPVGIAFFTTQDKWDVGGGGPQNFGVIKFQVNRVRIPSYLIVQWSLDAAGNMQKK